MANLDFEYDPDLDDFQPPAKKRAKKVKDRFGKPTSEEEIAKLAKGFVPENTKKNNSWALKVFNDWKSQRSTEDGEQCPDDLLENPDVTKLNYWLSRFVAEVRRADGNAYPPRTISQLVAALQRRMLENNPNASKFCNSHNTDFRDLTRTCDSVYRKLHSDGVGTVVKHTPTFSIEDENKLWETGSIGTSTPKLLQRAVFFYIGKRFCIRGRDKQQGLGPSQFRRSSDPDCYTYVEHGSKNRVGGVAKLRIENKVVPCYSVPEDGEKCLVSLLDTNLNKLPGFAFDKDIPYCHPKSTVPVRGPWYDSVAVGTNTLSSLVRTMCIDAGIAARTNHSLRATGATALFQDSEEEN